jgi:hypothetical protein
VAAACLSLGNSRTAHGEKEYKINDYLGSVRRVVDGSGDIIGGQDYKPFGGTFGLKWGTNRPGYIGKENDNESWLADHGVRKYDYEKGQVTNLPLRFSNTQTLNHSITQTLIHSNTHSLKHSNTHSLKHLNT